MRGNKGNFYEGGIRVPLIVKWPSVIKPDSTCKVPVISTDYYPTLLAIPANPPGPSSTWMAAIFCRSLSKPELKRGAYWHTNYIGAGHPGGARPWCDPCGDWKLIESFETNRLELFNLKDLGEQNDPRQKCPQRLRRCSSNWRLGAPGVQMPQPIRITSGRMIHLLFIIVGVLPIPWRRRSTRMF